MKQFRRCPGANELPAADGSNVFSARRGRGARLRPEPEVGGPVKRRVIAAVAVVLGLVCGAALALGAKADDDGGQQDLRAALRQRLRPHRGRRLQGRRRAGGQDRRRSRSRRSGGRPLARRGGRGHRAGAGRPAQGRALRDPPAVADRRVLRGLPAGHLRRAAPGRRAPARGADQLDDRDRPGQRHHAPALSRPPPADRGRARRGPRGPPGRPQRRAPPRASRRCARRARRCASSAARRSTIKKFIGDAHTVVGALENRKQDVVRFVREAGQTAEISASRREAARRELPGACPPSWPSSSPTWAASATSPRRRRRCCATSSPPPASSTPSSRGCARSRQEGLPAFKALGERVGGRPPRGAEDDRGGQRAAPAREGRARASPSRSASSSRRSTTASARSSRTTARGRDRPARGRQDAHDLEPRRLHRHGGDLELLLLADALHERAGRHRPRAAAEHRS